MRAKEFVTEDADGQQVLDYIHGTHHEPLTTQLQQAVLSQPRWELRSVPVSSLHIPDQEYDDEEQEPEADPYNRVQAIDPDHAGEYSANFVDRRPIVVDSEGWIIDGNHRAWAASELLNRSTIRAWVPVKQGVAESENNDTAISLSKLGKFHPGADSLAEFVPERATARYALHPDKWESTFYSLTNKDSDKLKYYGPKKISIPPGTLVGDMAIANKFYRAKTPEEKQQYAELYKASLQPYPVDVSAYRMPELLIPRQGMAEEQLDELFQPGKQNWAWKIKADTEAIAKFTVGDRDYVWQAFSHFRDDKPHKWEIQFRVVKQSTDPEKLQVYGTTGTGNSAEVMSNAVDIMREFLQYYGDGVQQIAFDAKENSRIALYRKMVQRLLPNWNADEDYSSDYGLRFTLTRPKSMAENFHDGKNPQDKGDSKRYGVPTKASVSTLRKVAKQGGRKGQLAHWMANMKAGRAKAKKK